MALFAQINSASALVIAALQLAATGHLLRRLGLARALACSPAVATLLMLGIAAAPSPLMVASGEVLRKVNPPLLLSRAPASSTHVHCSFMLLAEAHQCNL
jgi:hypothetical protein